MSTIVTILKGALSTAVAIFPFLRRATAERNAGLNPYVNPTGRVDDLLDGAIGRLGSMSVDDPLLTKFSNAAAGKFVRYEHFSKPYIREWISHPEVIPALKRMAKARIAAAPEVASDRELLISVHMQISGEHRSYAESNLSNAVSFLVASVQWAAKDAGVAAILQAGLESLNDRVDDVFNRLNVSTSPGSDWNANSAKQANYLWLTTIFSSKRQAKLHLRQPISPGDIAQGKPAAREKLVDTMTPFLTNQADGKVVVLIGDEGNGKSWLVAHSWLSIHEKPFMLVLTADDFTETVSASDIPKILINKLILQTKGVPSESFYDWWLRQLDQWRDSKKPGSVRLIVVIDGLNQRPSIDWGLIIEAMNLELERLGGRLVVTVRFPYYLNRVKPRLLSPTVEVKVPEWTEMERDAILATRGIVGKNLRQNVAASLRNPRLLGIALDLLQSAQIQELEELSISRLLFEHMRAHEREAPSQRPAHEFARTLQEHARKILDRVNSKRDDDLKVFESNSLEAVSDGRFFVPVKGDPTRYSLDEDGLTLALGFAILDELRKAYRNDRDIGDALDLMIDPISALDRTADAIVAALTVASFDEELPIEVSAAIVVAFANLQNPNDDDFSSFAALAQKRPESFLQAMYQICLASARPPNFDWIVGAVQVAKSDKDAWRVMAPILQAWLGYYSLSPETRMLPRHSYSSMEEFELERGKRRDAVSLRLSSLSDSEKDMLSNLVQNDVDDIGELASTAFTLMAGKPLASFAKTFVRWCFSNALNASLYAPHKDFIHLVRLNRLDWRDTRDAILKECELFKDVNLSETGKWALVSLLRATGDADDAAREKELVAELTADRKKFGHWRRVESYCSTDPCDPKSIEPANIEKTADSYTIIDVSKIRTVMGITGDDHFFMGARPGIARFKPLVGLDKHREFIENAIGRSGLPLRQGIFEVLNHNAILIPEHVAQLVQHVKTNKVMDACVGMSKTDQWIIFQYQLLIAFPFLSAYEQLQLMCSEHMHENFLLDLLDVGKPLEGNTFELELETAVRKSDEKLQFIILAFAAGTGTFVTDIARELVISLSQSPTERVRAQALGIIANIDSDQAIEAVVTSGWVASAEKKDNDIEVWNGSCVILEACKRGIIPCDEALSRISPKLYGKAVKILGDDAARYLGKFIDASIRRASKMEFDIAALDIEIVTESDGEMDRPRYRLSEKANLSKDPLDAFTVQTEDNKAFEERQERLRLAFEAFYTAVSQSNSGILLERFEFREFGAIAEANRELAQNWFDLFMGMSAKRLSASHNLGLLLAHAVANWNPDQAAKLFTNLGESSPIVRITYGRAGVTLDQMALWSATNHSSLKYLCFTRLDAALNNDELAQEVLAAHWAGKHDLLREYIQIKLHTGHPAEIARALMVVGFSDQHEFNDEVLAKYKDIPGFIGEAQSMASYAYARNTWAVHWFALICETQKREDFWRYSILLTKIVDGRFDIWKKDYVATGEPFRLFWPGIERQLKQRCEKWRTERKKNLFGEDAPSKVFLSVI